MLFAGVVGFAVMGVGSTTVEAPGLAELEAARGEAAGVDAAALAAAILRGRCT